jgi:hypothetical protein
VSKEFIQTVFYVKDNDQFESLLKESDIGDRKDFHALVLPKEMSGGRIYTKELVECCVNILQHASQGLRPSGEKQDGTTDFGVNARLMIIVKTMADTLQWIVNSTSWSVGKFLDFDSFEIKNKLSLVAGRRD